MRSRDNPRMSIVSKESKDTLTEGGLVYACRSRDNPRMSTVSKESKDTLTEGGLVCVGPQTIPGCP
jgi:hypothetical protein